MSRISLVAFPLVLLAAAACGNPGPPSSVEACTGPARDYAGEVVGSFNTTVGAIRRLDGLAEPARWPSMAPDDPAVLCYIDAKIAKGPPPGPSGEIREPYDRIVVGLVEGKAEVIMAGYRDRLPVKAP